MSRPLTISVTNSDRLDGETRSRLRALWGEAFGDRFTDDDADHAYGGIHVLARREETIVGHASAVPRRIRIGDAWWDVGYVEAVATSPDHQRAGVGTAVMRALHAELAARWPLAFLSTGRAREFYRGLGWEVWQGPSSVLTADGTELATDDEHGGIMVLRQAHTDVDLELPITCEDRPGDAW